jgi:hypothetical protein
MVRIQLQPDYAVSSFSLSQPLRFQQCANAMFHHVTGWQSIVKHVVHAG